MLEEGRIYLGTSRNPDDTINKGEYLELKYANRHGLVTGATGTGKTVSLQILAEGFSNAGVPVFCADIKGDLSGIAAMGEAKAGTYELGGPDVASFRDWIRQMLTVILRRRLIVNLPFWVASIMGNLLDFGSALTGRLFPNKILTADQVKTLKVDNVVAEGAKTLSDLGIAPTPAGAVLPDYLWRFRPSGQYDAIKASAKNLRQHG